jgi:hypothetical protein
VGITVLNRESVSLFGLLFGLFILSIFIFFEPPEDLSSAAWLTAGIALLMTIWWVTEAYSNILNWYSANYIISII